MICGMKEKLGKALGGVWWGSGKAGADGGLNGAEKGEEWWWEGVCWRQGGAVGGWSGFAFDG